jgi:carbon monoxide dehydrogenase subunit G
MKMTGEQRIAAPRKKVWDALNDPEILRQSIPGCQSLTKEPDGRLKAVVEVKIGPIGARFTGAVTLSDIDAPNGYTLSGEGQGGTVGSAKGSAKVCLTDDGGATRLSYDVDAQVGGRLAQLGGPIIDATAKQLADKFFRKFGEIVGGAPAAATSAQPAATTRPAEIPKAPAVSALPASVAKGGLPMAWILAIAVAALAGFLIGRGQGVGSDWMGLSIGLLLIVVAAAAFEYGRRAAAPVVTLDAALLARLSDGGKR